MTLGQLSTGDEQQSVLWRRRRPICLPLCLLTSLEDSPGTAGRVSDTLVAVANALLSAGDPIPYVCSRACQQTDAMPGENHCFPSCSSISIVMKVTRIGLRV
jgi:hypothetical protein